MEHKEKDWPSATIVGHFSSSLSAKVNKITSGLQYTVDQWFSTFLMLWPFNTVPCVVWPHMKWLYLEVWFCWSRHGLHGSVSWWEQLLRSQKLKSVFCLMPTDEDVEHSASPPASCLLACCHVSHDDNELNLWNCKEAPIKWFPL